MKLEGRLSDNDSEGWGSVPSPRLRLLQLPYPHVPTPPSDNAPERVSSSNSSENNYLDTPFHPKKGVQSSRHASPLLPHHRPPPSDDGVRRGRYASLGPGMTPKSANVEPQRGMAAGGRLSSPDTSVVRSRRFRSLGPSTPPKPSVAMSEEQLSQNLSKLRSALPSVPGYPVPASPLMPHQRNGRSHKETSPQSSPTKYEVLDASAPTAPWPEMTFFSGRARDPLTGAPRRSKSLGPDLSTAGLQGLWDASLLECPDDSLAPVSQAMDAESAAARRFETISPASRHRDSASTLGTPRSGGQASGQEGSSLGSPSQLQSQGLWSNRIDHIFSSPSSQTHPWKPSTRPSTSPSANIAKGTVQNGTVPRERFPYSEQSIRMPDRANRSILSTEQVWRSRSQTRQFEPPPLSPEPLNAPSGGRSQSHGLRAQAYHACRVTGPFTSARGF